MQGKVLFQTPYGAREHRQPRAERPQGRARDRERAHPAQGCAVCAPAEATDRVRGPAMFAGADSGARFLLVSFLCANKEKKPARGAGNRK